MNPYATNQLLDAWRVSIEAEDKLQAVNEDYTKAARASHEVRHRADLIWAESVVANQNYQTAVNKHLKTLRIKTTKLADETAEIRQEIAKQAGR